MTLSWKEDIAPGAFLVFIFGLAMYLLITIGGCAIKTTKHGEVGFKLETDWALYHTGADDGTPAIAESDLQPWLFDLVQAVQKAPTECPHCGQSLEVETVEDLPPPEPEPADPE